MEYLARSLTRPFENKKNFAISVLLYLALTIILTLIVILILIKPLGVNALDTESTGKIFQEENFWENIKQNLPNLVGGIALILIVSIIIGSIIEGYFLRCIQTALKGQYKLPKWNNWINLFKKGFVMGIIYLIYFLALAVSMLLVIIPIIGVIIVFIIFLLLIYNLPMIEVFYARGYNFNDAFKIKEMFKKTFTLKYLGNGLVLLLIVIAISVFGFITNILLGATIILPIIVNAIIYAYIGIFSATAFANLYKEIH